MLSPADLAVGCHCPPVTCVAPGAALAWFHDRTLEVRDGAGSGQHLLSPPVLHKVADALTSFILPDEL